MSRVHLFEFEDQSWLPRPLRDYMTDWLDFMNARNRGWEVFAPHVASLVRASGSERIVDLGSGGGGPAPRLRGVLAETFGLDPMLVLTDIYPNRDAIERAAADPSGRVAYRREPVDASRVPTELDGTRTLFCSFHHFRPAAARRILADACEKGEPLGVFEGTTRTLPAVLVTITAPIAVLLTTPFIRPLRWGRIAFTYLLPIVPLLVLWDGIVSCLRSYSADELKALVRDMNCHGYEWEVGEIRFPKTPVTVAYLLGYAQSSREASSDRRAIPSRS